MSDLDLDELRDELDDFAQPEKKGGRSRARSASSRDSKKFSVLLRGMVMLHSTEKIATSLNGSMRFDSTVFALLRNAYRFSSRSTIRGC